jgi:hypothetical protein
VRPFALPLRCAQLGLTFSDAEGNLPLVDGAFCAWQFNFRRAPPALRSLCHCPPL